MCKNNHDMKTINHSGTLVAKLQQTLSLLTCLLILASLAILQHGKLLGHNLNERKATTGDTITNNSIAIGIEADSTNALRILEDGSMLINTTSLASDISGYAGAVPLEINIKHNVITSVKALENKESKPFFDKASALLKSWNGKTIAEAQAMEVDAVSGATFSSKAIIGNVKRGLQYAQRATTETANTTSHNASAVASDVMSALSLKNIASLVVVLLAAILPLFVRSQRWHMLQMILNVVVLGFWCGTFLSYTSVVGFFANGWQGWAFISLMVMLVTAFVYPLFGKPSYYCTNVCPFGSLQQLAGSVVRFKMRLTPSAIHRLDIVRQMLWALLMLFIWSGVWSAWTDYEPFTAFIFDTASWVAICIAIVFVILSFVVTRPYCRFVCPMGTLLRYIK